MLKHRSITSTNFDAVTKNKDPCAVRSFGFGFQEPPKHNRRTLNLCLHKLSQPRFIRIAGNSEVPQERVPCIQIFTCLESIQLQAPAFTGAQKATQALCPDCIMSAHLRSARRMKTETGNKFFKTRPLQSWCTSKTNICLDSGYGGYWKPKSCLETNKICKGVVASLVRISAEEYAAVDGAGFATCQSKIACDVPLHIHKLACGNLLFHNCHHSFISIDRETSTSFSCISDENLMNTCDLPTSPLRILTQTEHGQVHTRKPVASGVLKFHPQRCHVPWFFDWQEFLTGCQSFFRKRTYKEVCNRKVGSL